MPRHYRVTAILPPGRRYYVAYFHTASGKRVGRGLGTDDKGKADVICTGLARLWMSGARVRSQAPDGLDPDALDLFFGDRTERADTAPVDALQDAHAALSAEERLEQALAKAAQYKRDLENLNEAHQALQRSAIGRMVEAGRRAPPIAQALEKYAAHIATKTTPGNAGTHARAAREFAATLPLEVRTFADVTPEQISGFLDAKAAAGNPAKKKSRRRAWYLLVSRLVNWAASTWSYPSQMEGVPRTRKGEVLAERGDIHWHELAEVEAALEALPARLKARKGKAVAAAEVAYWRALVGMLAYAGLQLAELAWLRRKDLELAANRLRGSVWITTVEDAGNPEQRHAVKTEHRRRRVDLNPKRLMPLIREYLDAGHGAGEYLFPLPPGMPRRRRRGALCERWRVDGLSRVLRGDPGGKNPSKGKKPKAATSGLLPVGMNAKSLRRTFGSILIRSRRPDGGRYGVADVAALMGNSEAVIADHYAKILGREVDVEF